MARTLSVQSQLSNHEVDHLFHPVSAVLLELVQESVSVQLAALLLTEIACHELQDDSLAHLGPIIVVILEDVSDVQAGGGQSLTGQED